MKSALYIGRFQPFHNGHLDAVKQIVNAGYERVVLGIGSCQEKRTSKNPLSYDERKSLIESAFGNQNIDYDILSIPDFGDDLLWTNYVVNNLNFDTVFTGNDWTQKCFEEYSKKQVYRLNQQMQICATDIREKIVNNGNWQELVHENVANNLMKNGLEKIIVNCCRPELKTPYLAVDGIVETTGGIVLIERLNEPFGYALPGGFVDIGESCEDALVREMSEEVCLDVRDLNLFGMYSAPLRDPRQHIASCVYVCKSNGIPKAADDAKKVFVVPIEKLGEYDLVFDHRKIIDDYIKSTSRLSKVVQ
jgi:8-oxo-dGTP diphosphatase